MALRESERALLQTAGFTRAMVRVLDREAATIPLLWLKRSDATIIVAALGPLIAIALGAGLLGDLPGGELIGVGIAAGIALIVVVPDLFTYAMAGREPVRWATRRLVLRAIAAKPKEGDDAFESLQRHAQLADGQEPRTALRRIAQDFLGGETDEAIVRLNPSAQRDWTGVITLIALMVAIALFLAMQLLAVG